MSRKKIYVYERNVGAESDGEVLEVVRGHECALVYDAEGEFMFAAPPHLATYLSSVLNASDETDILVDEDGQKRSYANYDE